MFRYDAVEWEYIETLEAEFYQSPSNGERQWEILDELRDLGYWALAQELEESITENEV